MSKFEDNGGYYIDGVPYMDCKYTGTPVRNVSTDVKYVISDKALQAKMYKMFPEDFEEKTKTYKPTGRPAGWHFMNEFVDKDGNVFHKGKEQPDLKGTLKPTKIKTKKRFNKKEKLRLMQNANAQLFELKKKLKNAKFKKDIKKIEVQMRKFQRIAAGKIPKSLRQG